MWTTLGAVILIGGLLAWVIHYAKAAVKKDLAAAAANAAAEEEKERREQAEAQAVAESNKRVEKFNEEAAAVHDAGDAAKLLKDAAGRTARGTVSGPR